ncbi:MAG: MBL fold metallo-hydrolase [Promethearchaeota archaeon]|nr:MAG: MBL fold metallo-hydrolase [Candidatus Lokiarchaeota archaeon]
MKDDINHFRVTQEKEYLYIIREDISRVHPIYRNDPLNIYLILGEEALLMDTGCGLFPIKPLVDRLIGERDLIVINTHFHWDHVLGNHEFDTVKIHKNEAEKVSKTYDVSFFKNSPKKLANKYAKYDYLIPPANEIQELKDGDIFDLGGSEIKVIHTPGHSPGSICLLSDTGELYTSDVAYYGDLFLPKKDKHHIFLDSLSRLIKICNENVPLQLYPSHCQAPCSLDLLLRLKDGIEKIPKLWDDREYSEFFSSWQIDDPPFRYYISKY